MRLLPSSPPTSDEFSLRYHGWRVVVLCFFMALFAWGFGFYGHAVYLAELQRIHGWPASLIATASTVYYVCSAALVAFVGDAIARFGPRRMVLGGIACLAGSTLLLPLVEAPWQLYAIYMVMAGGWASLSLGAITNLIGLWFHARRGLAISLALNGASCGGIVIAPILVAVSAQAGFRAAMVGMTIAMLAVLLPLALAWAQPPRAAAAPGAPAAAPPARWSKRRALGNLHFWTVSAPFALALTAQVGFIVHQIAYLTPMLGRSGTAWAVALTTTMAVVGRVGLGTIIDRLDQRFTACASFASQAAALLVMAGSDAPAVLLAACAVFGFSVGNLITFPALIIQREFDTAAFGMLIALSTAIGQVSYAFGPGILGFVRDFGGGYGSALMVCVAWDLLAAVLILWRPKTPDAV